MFCFHHFAHDAFFLLRGLLGPPFWRVLLRTLLYIPMSFLLLNDTNDLLFRNGERIKRLSYHAPRCISCHWEISQFLLASMFWSVLWHYTGWIDVLVRVCQCFKIQDSFEYFPCFWLALSLSSQDFPSGMLLDFNASSDSLPPSQAQSGM